MGERPAKGWGDVSTPLAEYLRGLRDGMNPRLSYRAIANAAGTSAGSVHSIFAGTQHPALDRALAIAASLGGDPGVVETAWRASQQPTDRPDPMTRCLRSLLDGGPVPVAALAALGIEAAATIAEIAGRLGVPIEVGTAADWAVQRRRDRRPGVIADAERAVNED